MITKLQNQSFIDDEVKQRNNLNSDSRYNEIRDNVLKNVKHFTQEERTRIVIEGQGNEISIQDICIRVGISPLLFYQWTQEFLNIKNIESDTGNIVLTELTSDTKFKIVIEGRTGTSSIAEICRRENISQDTFLVWNQEFIDVRNNNFQKPKVRSLDYKKNKHLISTTSSTNTLDYIENYIDLFTEKTIVITKSNNLILDKWNDLDSIISLQKINDVRYINKYFEQINSKLLNKGIFIGCMETFTARRDRMKINDIAIINNIYFGLEFVVKRILPKLSFTKKRYFDITKGSDRLLSKAEGLGRLVCCGFSIMDYKTIDGMLYFVVRKVSKPSFDMNPSYGPLYKMPRLGKNGKIFGVYKFRTMHPYSEYLQDYILRANGYANSGKPANDFRIPLWAKFMRKYWLDELPQLMNVLKGEMKLVGVRPVSQRYFRDIPKEMQKLRLTQKPGCIPPYVALNKEGNVMSVLQSERQYLEEKIKNPYFTDTKYFIKAIFNIVFKHKRSA